MKSLDVPLFPSALTYCSRLFRESKQQDFDGNEVLHPLSRHAPQVPLVIRHIFVLISHYLLLLSTQLQLHARYFLCVGPSPQFVFEAF
jgi:hypothetical protein